MKKNFIICCIPVIFFIFLMTRCRSNIIEMFLTDGLPPYIVSTSPANEEKGVPLDVRIEIVFSESMERSSVEQAMSLNPGNPELSFNWDADSRDV